MAMFYIFTATTPCSLLPSSRVIDYRRESNPNIIGTKYKSFKKPKHNEWNNFVKFCEDNLKQKMLLVPLSNLHPEPMQNLRLSVYHRKFHPQVHSTLVHHRQVYVPLSNLHPEPTQNLSVYHRKFHPQVHSTLVHHRQVYEIEISLHEKGD